MPPVFIVTRGEAKSPYIGIDDRDGRTLDTILEGVLQPYWDDPALSPHRPGFDRERKAQG